MCTTNQSLVGALNDATCRLGACRHWLVTYVRDYFHVRSITHLTRAEATKAVRMLNTAPSISRLLEAYDRRPQQRAVKEQPTPKQRARVCTVTLEGPGISLKRTVAETDLAAVLRLTQG